MGVWGDPASFGNAYTYVGNNPINARDPLGRKSSTTATLKNLGSATLSGNKPPCQCPSGQMLSIYYDESADGLNHIAMGVYSKGKPAKTKGAKGQPAINEIYSFGGSRNTFGNKTKMTRKQYLDKPESTDGQGWVA